MSIPRVRAAVACLVVAAALLAGCRRQGSAVAPPSAEAPVEPATDADLDLLGALSGATLELYGHLSLGNTGAYVDAIASNQPIALFGITAQATVIGRSPRGAARDRRVFRVMGPTLLAKNLEVAMSDDGSLGWVYDEMSYRVTYEQRTASIPIRQTSLWVRDFDRWVEVVEHWSYAQPTADLERLAAAGQLPSPARFQTPPQAGPAREILRLIGRLHDGIGGDRAALFAAPERVLVLLPDGEHRGATAIAGPSLAQRFGEASTVAVRDYRLTLAQNGVFAWVAANLVVRTLVNEDPVEIGLRGTYLLERGEAGWRAVQIHISAPISTAELSRRVFGTE